MKQNGMLTSELIKKLKIKEHHLRYAIRTNSVPVPERMGNGSFWWSMRDYRSVEAYFKEKK